MNHDNYLVRPGHKFRLKDYDPASTGKFADKGEAAARLQDDIVKLAELQAMLYAQNTNALLIVLQGMDTAGKDGTIRHVISGVNPQGTQVHSFRAPSAEELDHDYLWRSMRALPERGDISIFNRSYYEEVLVVRVHPELLERQKLPPHTGKKSIWKRRFEEINAFEKYLTHNGIVVLKFFLNLSKDEQKRRLLDRLNTPDKNWKVSAADSAERLHWDEYIAAFEDAIKHTSSAHAPWHIVPADNKWFAHAVVADAIVGALKKLKVAYPVVSEARRLELVKVKQALEAD